jgi:ferredoxin, 2Fe-2S
MAVDITFEPDDLSGLVAESTYLWDAAKRMGIRRPTECSGRGECTSCAVRILDGAELLSAPTEAERTMLGPERLEHGERLACQVRIERSGALRVELLAVTESTKTKKEELNELRKKFAEMPLNQKLATLVEFEAATMFEAINSVAEVPAAIAGRVFDVIARRGRFARQRQRDSQRPAEHRHNTDHSKQ